MSEPTIKGFRKHGNGWRAQVVLDTEDATDVAAEAEDRKLPAAAVMRERIHKARSRKGSGR
jgi:hypothetical protein